MKNKITALTSKKNSGKKIVALTAYDFPTARVLEEAGADMILVGDSLAMVVRGEKNTRRVTMDEMIYHAKMVTRATKTTLIVGDMPINSYRTSAEALKNAKRFIKEGGVDAVKLEGGATIIKQVRHLIKHKIPVLGHIGMTPQKARSFKVKGRSPQGAAKILKDAQVLDQAGVFAMVLECIPARLSKEITQEVSCATIGIGAGKDTSGQILVSHDVFGVRSSVSPRFVRQYENLESRMKKAAGAFIRDVSKGRFPSDQESFR